MVHIVTTQSLRSTIRSIGSNLGVSWKDADLSQKMSPTIVKMMTKMFRIDAENISTTVVSLAATITCTDVRCTLR